MEHVMNENFTKEEFNEVYQKFLDNKASVKNARSRPDNESLWDVLTTTQDDFFKSPEGAIIDELAKDILKSAVKV
jgi:hypothetical protein